MGRTVVFVIEEKKHPRFERVDDDLTVTLNITLSQALLGPDGGGEITKEVNQLDGRRIPVTAPAGVSRYSWCRSSLISPDCSTRPNYQDSRRGYASIESRIRQEARRSFGKMERDLPDNHQHDAKAGTAEGFGIEGIDRRVVVVSDIRR
jgi:hypothetical protein